ncbi:RNA pseudouridine synthase [Tamlana fucoidanivorans]|uniref:RNA pseudouridine synthase n=1 Tax=Allotamlana fucoidanivorans TaxID=2583814 RepID=A0A5C4SH63_9FLAO|nr:pseudouridine synthase [Tamlana fucoidanivorans]TNJ42975.1 RNA pseudouridine synthase [Tamlana fucoidanivorans]
MPLFSASYFHEFRVTELPELPEKFTFPFYYEPHPLCIMAAQDVQQYLETQTDFVHNFGLNSTLKGNPIGKMFGVMVVKNEANKLGYLAAFSGKLAESNDIKGFVPTIYNTLNQAGFYKKGEATLNRFNAEIKTMEASKEFALAQKNIKDAEVRYQTELLELKQNIKSEKKHRDQERAVAKQVMLDTEYAAFNELLSEASKKLQIELKQFKRHWKYKQETLEKELSVMKLPIDALKQKRAALSATLQSQLHQQYRFLNANGEECSLLDIFRDTVTPIPPAGSGECAAPKLFQYAYQNHLEPLAMAEFWWGVSPKSEVRKHKQFYPSCRSKCEPILGHMMKGLQVDNNPILQIPHYNEDLDIVFEDDYLLLVNKPHEFLSVPGKRIQESVYTKMKQYLPHATGPLLVHRLDMSTSGLLLVAKNMRVHKQLQKQFIERTVKKRYIALLDGVIEQKEGVIDLPLRVDLDNRPQQLVCYKHGKLAKTKFEVITVEDGKTRVYFYPITGRTHQLRVHAAHQNGLKTPILGDDLYGTKLDRLHLHAERITFKHPILKEELTVHCSAPF